MENRNFLNKYHKQVGTKFYEQIATRATEEKNQEKFQIEKKPEERKKEKKK